MAEPFLDPEGFDEQDDEDTRGYVGTVDYGEEV